MIQVAICSASPVLRAGLHALISADPGLAVVALAATPEELGAMLHAMDPAVTPLALPRGKPAVDVMIISADALGGRLPALLDEGWQALGASPPGAILLISEDVQAVARMRQAGPLLESLGAWGALTPDASDDALRAAIRALASGLVVVSPELSSGLEAVWPSMRNGQPAQAEEGPIEALTARESEVLRLLADGLTNKQLGLALGISEHTVKFHVSSIYGKLGVSNRAEAVQQGARRGWLAL